MIPGPERNLRVSNRVTLYKIGCFKYLVLSFGTTLGHVDDWKPKDLKSSLASKHMMGRWVGEG